MNCFSCNATLPDSSKFCPFCGFRLVKEMAASANAPVPAGPGLSARDSLSREMTSRFPSSKTLPKKYAAQLAAGVRPEVIIAELIERREKLRALLEQTTRVIERMAGRYPGEMRGDVVEGIKDYLRQHCRVCGARIVSPDDGSAALCKDCV